MTRTPSLVAAVRDGDAEALRAALGRGEDPAERDERGWAALDWAAGRGDVPAVRALLDAGADPRARGPEGRSPYEIAVAAGKVDAARVLREVTGEGADGWRPYCKAYLVAALRAFPDWSTVDGEGLTAETVVYLHHDLTVTRSIWHGEDVLWSHSSPEWAEFCREDLGFRVPDDLELVPGGSGTGRR
ncbi:ankyrin repeat domain-containing protein [Streptoalloteichus hindustanus]|nr:ankyrin repeat domain-containing protein [Streptoalloteichus hindustanus]SHF86334.1 Ankyrin repeat-containing protein [Streptoalloteichus hindustanus]